MSASGRRAFHETAREERLRDGAEAMLAMLKDCSCFILDNNPQSQFLKTLDAFIKSVEEGHAV